MALKTFQTYHEMSSLDGELTEWIAPSTIKKFALKNYEQGTINTNNNKLKDSNYNQNEFANMTPLQINEKVLRDTNKGVLDQMTTTRTKQQPKRTPPPPPMPVYNNLPTINNSNNATYNKNVNVHS
eukprot:Pgem_evm2s4025